MSGSRAEPIVGFEDDIDAARSIDPNSPGSSFPAPTGIPAEKRRRDATASGDSDGYVSGSDAPVGSCVGFADGQVPLQS